MSASDIAGWWSRSPRLTSLLHITPEEIRILRDDRSHLPGFSFRAFNMGFAKASPTMIAEFARVRSTVSQSSSASKFGFSNSTAQPPPTRFPIVVKSPVPCISGHAVICRGPGPWRRTFSGKRLRSTSTPSR